MRRGEQLLNLAVRALQSCAHLLTSLGPVRRSLLDLLLKLLEHLSHLLLHDIRHIQVDASSDGLQQLIGFGNVVSQPAQIQILCADQLILALRHVHSPPYINQKAEPLIQQFHLCRCCSTNRIQFHFDIAESFRRFHPAEIRTGGLPAGGNTCLL